MEDYQEAMVKSLVAVAWAVTLLVAQAAFAQDTLRVLTWPGYADADLVKVFEQKTGSKVEVTVIDSDDAMWQKLNKNKAGDFDVFAVNTAGTFFCTQAAARHMIERGQGGKIINMASQAGRRGEGPVAV